MPRRVRALRRRGGACPFAVLAACFVAASAASDAQSMRVSSVVDAATGPLLAAGWTVSKNGVSIPFTLRREPLMRAPETYIFDGAAVEALKAGDKVQLFLSRLSGSTNKVPPGECKRVTVVAVRAQKDAIEIDIKESLRFDGGVSAKTLRLRRTGGFVTDATAAAR